MNATTPTPRIELSRWEAEGGTPLPSAMQPGGDAPLLQRLGAALVAEWNKLPMPLQRAIYDRAVAAGLADDDEPALKRRMALFLHQHKRPATPD
jgi:hypothetical protein